ncbi:LacI family transcriptional regulator [Lampropedia cohaerens]|uniref:LacI family transcriptional regulator n=1 Tax=Lampropedia cohaerens TaxID=1610491 RepID=A0A0U1Q3E4_9BURK|nr:tripartite tricarboxylate transporter substrate binding protein [Lampropedia cohaerens]KKW69269.1 LacI family transcriptional regulator [Lampropedia cohaerens]
MFKKLLIAVGFSLAATLVAAQGWPTKPVRMIVPFPPGGGTDILARLLASELSAANGWNIVADNKPGAGGTLGIGEAVKAAPDGYTIVLGQKDNLVIGPWLYPRLGWNPVDDLEAVAHIAYSPVLISTSIESPYRTLADVVAAAKAEPGAVTYGSPGNGTSIHLAAHLFEQATGIAMTHVPYRGSNPALVDVMAGNVALLVSSVPSAIGQIKAGKLRPLAVTSAHRSSSLPDVPTVAESAIAGVEDFDVSTWYGVMAPKGTPEPLLQALHARIDAALDKPQLQEAIRQQGAEPQAQAREAFAAFLKADYETWQTIVQGSGVQLD